jgi:hypothetical protein
MPPITMALNAVVTDNDKSDRLTKNGFLDICYPLFINAWIVLFEWTPKAQYFYGNLGKLESNEIAGAASILDVFLILTFSSKLYQSLPNRTVRFLLRASRDTGHHERRQPCAARQPPLQWFPSRAQQQ